MSFPKNFDYGIAASAYQIEGGWQADGKGKSIWDVYVRRPGVIEDGQTGDIGCDHYTHYEKDIALMKEMGVDTYRLSISWARVFPQGRGEINAEGLAFYDRVIDALLKAGISPVVNLHHYDLPQAMMEEGGWPSRSVIDASVEYAKAIFSHFKGRVSRYISINDARSTLLTGYIGGVRAPGYTGRVKEAIAGWYHINLAMAMARKALREIDSAAHMSFIVGILPVYPLEDNDQCRKAADDLSFFYNDCFVSPLLKGVYPEKLRPWLESQNLMPEVLPADMQILKENPQDAVGINYYTVMRVKPNPHGNPGNPMSMFTREIQGSVTDSGWEIHPEGLYDAIEYLKSSYDNPSMFVAETGGSFKDEKLDGDIVQDNDRIQLLSDTVLQAERALKEGANLTGFHIWSLLDNFEWQSGFSKKFGLIRVDRATGARYPKKSAYWYRDWISNQKALSSEQN